MLIIVWVIVGIVAAIAFGSFMASQGRESSLVWNAVAGAVGGFIGGFLFSFIGTMMLGPGLDSMASFLGAGIVGALAVMIVRMIKK